MIEKLLKIEPYLSHLDLLYVEYWDKLEKTAYIQLNKLLESEPLPKTGGIYVFYTEKDKPIYVGRTKNIRQRIQLHTRNSSKEESATFVFNLTKIHFEDNKRNDILFKNNKKQTRKDLMNDIEFKEVFQDYKLKLQNMFLKFIIEDHDILQTIIEPYIALKLGTYPKYNSFETH